MDNKFSEITELPGNYVTLEQLEMICQRYYTAGRFARKLRVLEVGCGPGLGLKYLSKIASLVIGGDLNYSSVCIAKKNNCSPVLCLDGQRLPFKNNSFDLIIIFEVLFYFKEPSLFFNEARRVLVSNGTLILCQPNKDLPTFIPSKFSNKYYSVLGMYEIGRKYFKSVIIYGVFPMDIYKIQKRSLRLSIAKIFNYIPSGNAIKFFLKRFIISQNILLNDSIPDNLEISSELQKLDPSKVNKNYQIIYAIMN